MSVAFVAPGGNGLSDADVEQLCRKSLAGYKHPKAIHFIRFEECPRSTAGKILRHEMESLYRDRLA